MADSTGLMESLKRLTDTLLVIVRTRLELLSNEIEDERLYIEQKLFYGGVALLFFGLTAILLTAFVVVMFWDSYRLLVLAGFIVMYLVAGLLAWSAMRRLARQKTKLFSASLAELVDDCDQLAPRP